MVDTVGNGHRGKILYALMILAAIAVIVLSLIGIATMTGHMPGALSKNGSEVSSQAANDRATRGATPAAGSVSKPAVAGSAVK